MIWELLCQELKEDLIIVTKDKTFFDNISLLSEEYRKRTGHALLLVTENFSEALRRIGQIPPPQLVIAEEEVKRQALTVSKVHVFTQAKIREMLNKEICPVCGAGGRIWGFDGSDGDAFDCFECHSCGLLQDLAGFV